MDDKEKSKALVFAMSVFLWAFYVFIAMYALFAVAHIYLFRNFAVGITFEIIGACILAVMILGRIIFNQIKTGYFVPLVMVTVVYTVILNCLNLLGIAIIPHSIFTMLHFVLLFFYCIVSIPMYIMGKR